MANFLYCNESSRSEILPLKYTYSIIYAMVTQSLKKKTISVYFFYLYFEVWWFPACLVKDGLYLKEKKTKLTPEINKCPAELIN